MGEVDDGDVRRHFSQHGPHHAHTLIHRTQVGQKTNSLIATAHAPQVRRGSPKMNAGLVATPRRHQPWTLPLPARPTWIAGPRWGPTQQVDTTLGHSEAP